MNILAFDTSGQRLSVAAQVDGRAAACTEDELDGRHAERLVPAIERTLKRARLAVREIHLIAVGTGPGSFTGLRVGVTTAKTLALALGVGLAGVCSFEAIARARRPSGPVCVVADAKRGRWHAALYVPGRAGLLLRKGPAVIDRDRLTSWAGAAVIAGEPCGEHPRADEIAAIAREAAAARRLSDPRKLVPLYLHPKDCNATRPKKN